MHVLLTDRLACPRCGPEFGLILLADRMADRRVYEGTLGCPNCRDRFPVRDAFADLRAPPRQALGAGLAGPDPAGDPDADATEADRVGALLGVARGPATVALVGAPARFAARVAASVEDLEVVAIDPDVATWADAPGVSRLVAWPMLPFFTRVLRGVVVDGRLGPEWVGEAARVAAPLSRVVVVSSANWVAGTLRERGLTVLASEGETVVAARG
jgi:uncharacterized protein YbaR (Trm112 family)